MHILYLDDSGSAGNRDEAYFVLGGVCVPEGSVRWLAHEVERVVEAICQDCPETVELHAAAIFSGRDNIWKTMDRPARIALIKRVLLVLDNAYSDVVVMACAVHKASFPNDDPVRLAFEDLSSRFDMLLKRRSLPGEPMAKGLIVLDKSTYETTLQDMAGMFRRQGNRWGSYLTSICEVPLFVDSTASRNIQLADHIAYAVFRYYNAADMNYFRCIEGRFDHDAESGVLHGLAHRELNRPQCTCPACMSRR